MKKMITILMAMLCCGLLAIACPVFGPHQKFMITDRSTSLPLSGVTVTLLYEHKPARHIVTDSTGVFYFFLMGGEAYKLVVKYDGYSGVDQELLISEEKNMEIDIRLSTVKKSKVRVYEYDRYRRQPFTPINREEQIALSRNADPSYTAISCNMKHENRKSEMVLSRGGKVFNEVKVYPNPIEKGFPVSVESKFDEQKVLVLYNMSGVEIFRGAIVYHQVLETSLLKPGIYIVKIIDVQNDDVAVQKLIVY